MGGREIGVRLGLVLIVDDSAAFRDIARRVLIQWRHTVVVAGSVQEALAVAARHRPVLALVDIGLPDGDGFDLAIQLRLFPTPARIALLSTDSDPGTALAAERPGGARFFPKVALLSDEFRQFLDG